MDPFLKVCPSFRIVSDILYAGSIVVDNIPVYVDLMILVNVWMFEQRNLRSKIERKDSLQFRWHLQMRNMSIFAFRCPHSVLFKPRVFDVWIDMRINTVFSPYFN
jgi:hypothetical protein